VSLALTSAIPLQAERSADLDATTVEGCRAGDPAAIEAFIARYQHVVFAFLSRTIGPGPHVEDLAQEVFLRACRALPRFEPDGAARLSTWLLTIANRVAIDARRKRRVPLRPIDAGREIAHPSTPETERRRLEIGRAIADAAAQLPDDQLDAFVLAELHGLEMHEIGRVLGIPENTAKTRIHRARERLRVLLKEIWEEL
jgi:RNA polymerase sigma-70 factor (ECF subfamily)